MGERCEHNFLLFCNTFKHHTILPRQLLNIKGGGFNYIGTMTQNCTRRSETSKCEKWGGEKDINKKDEGEHIFTTTLSLCDFLFEHVCAQMLKFWKNVCAIAHAWNVCANLPLTFCCLCGSRKCGTSEQNRLFFGVMLSQTFSGLLFYFINKRSDRGAVTKQMASTLH